MTREELLAEIRRRLEKRQPVLLTGESGIGKSWLLQQLAVALPDAIYVSHVANKKTMLLDLAQRMWRDNRFPAYTYYVQWPDVEKQLNRLKIPQLNELIHPHLIHYTILLDNLQFCTEKTLFDIVLPLMAANICAAGYPTSPAQERKLRIVADKFSKVAVPPLEPAEAVTMLWQLLDRHTVEHPETIEDRVLAAANGKPLVIADLAAQLRGSNGTLPELRELDHSQQQETHINLLVPTTLILLTLLFAGRYLARAFDDSTLTILAAILYASSYMLRPLLYRLGGQ